jgi:hypothetical protein
MSEWNNMMIYGDTSESNELINQLRNRIDDSFIWNYDRIDVHVVQHMTISNVQLDNMDFLVPFVSLKYLCISFNKVVDITPVCSMRGLQVFDASHNKIIDISPLAECPELSVVRLQRNAVESLEPLHLALDLRELWVNGNKLQLVDFMHLILLTKLQHIVIDQNPFESKAKYIEFMVALCPSLLSVSGVPVMSLLPSATNKQWYNPSEFLRTTDGRVMLTQTRSQLTESQREFLTSQKSPIFAGTLVEGGGGDHPPFRGMSQDCSALDHRRMSNMSSMMLAGGDNASTVRAASEGGRPIKYFKAKKKNTPKMFIRHQQQQQQGEGEEEGEGGDKDGDGSSNSLSGGHSLSHDNSSASSSAGAGGGYTQKQMVYPNREEATVIRFGEGTAAPVAACLEQDGTGYSRCALPPSLFHIYTFLMRRSVLSTHAICYVMHCVSSRSNQVGNQGPSGLHSGHLPPIRLLPQWQHRSGAGRLWQRVGDDPFWTVCAESAWGRGGGDGRQRGSGVRVQQRGARPRGRDGKRGGVGVRRCEGGVHSEQLGGKSHAARLVAGWAGGC